MRNGVVGIKKILFYTLQLSWLMLGFFIYGLSIVLVVKAGLGVSPWDVFHLGAANYLPFTFGQIMIGAGFLCIAISLPMGVRPRSGTILNMIFIGVFTDLIIAGGWIPEADDYLARSLYLVVGVLSCGLATGVYITANMGTGPRDSLMMGLHHITGWRIGVVRTIIEVAVTLLGFLLGGPVGLGTVAFSLTIGFSSELFLSLFCRCGLQEWFIASAASLNPDVGQGAVNKN
ncbi:MAG: hypothetical protein JL50_17530 [Peptococcaceae bacterium BICA1-7]|nr:MAG: hypothetical protein JL50_17530 [Peptococcaceae bacterium BICA1-7]